MGNLTYATYANQRMTLTVKSPISSRKAEYEGCATWLIPRGVSSHHVFRRAFGDAYCRHENVRHATLFSAQECKRANYWRGKKREKMNIKKLSDATLKEFYDRMKERIDSCAKNPKEEEVYETQSDDYQNLFREIENEMKHRSIIP